MQVEPTDEELAELDAGFRPSSVFEGLEQIWAEAQVPRATPKQSKQLLVEAENATKALYANPANWERRRGIALIHTETNTLLGNFSEYIHLRVRDCRKLIREDGPLAVSASEYVSGNWWLNSRRPQTPQVWHVRHQATVSLTLPELDLFAPAVYVIAFLSYGKLERVELGRPARFSHSTSECFIDLPEGVDVFEVLAQSSKEKIMKEIGK